MRRLTALTGLLCVTGLLGARPAQGANLRDLLRRSTYAEQRISFQGTKILTGRTGEAESRGTAKVYHRAPDQTLIVGVDGALDGLRVLQFGREHYQKRRGDLFRLANHVPASDSTELMLQNYTLREMRTEPIARRKCIQVSIEPKHPGNPRKLVWLDVKTALPLKTQIWSPEGKLCEESYFLTIQYRPRLTPSLFRLPSNTVRDPWPSANPDFDVVSVPDHGLPPGYHLVETTTRRIPGQGIVSIQRFSDGLNTLSLLQSNRISARELADLGGSAAVSGKVGSVHFALCGEQQPEALRRVKQSIQAPH
jgi:negative regulator of sigma E activity